MSYGGCENVPTEIADLVGGKITEAGIVEDEEFGTVVELTVVFRKGHTIECEGHTGQAGIYQIWMDPEGNGPGFLSLVGVGTLEKVPANAK